MTSQSIADDVTMTRQSWCDHVNGVSNSLDIDFIHGDIHDRSSKGYMYYMTKKYFWYFIFITAGNVYNTWVEVLAVVTPLFGEFIDEVWVIKFW